MRYVIVYAIRGEAGRVHMDLTKRFAEHFSVCNVADDIEPHFTLKAPFETDDITPVDATLRAFVAREAPVPVTLGGVNTFNNRVIFMDARADAATHAFIRRLQNALRVLPWLPWYPTEDPIRLHATLGYAKNDVEARDMFTWFDAQAIPSFDLPIDALTLFVRGEKRWELHTPYPLSGE